MTGLTAPAELSMRDAAARIISAQVRELRDNHRPARRGKVTAIHQMRVAVRRLRAALRMFKDYVVPPRRLGRRLRRLSGRLARVRDRDVALALLEQVRDGLGIAERKRLDELLVELRRDRRRARRRLKRRLTSGRNRRLRRRLKRFAAAPTLCGARDDAASLGLEAVVTRLAGDIAELPAMREAAPDADALHRLRIVFRRLRYALEFHADLGAVAFAAELKLARAMQDCLGDLHDLDLLRGRLRDDGGAFARRWTGLRRRLAAARLVLLRRFLSLRGRWSERTGSAAGAPPLAQDHAASGTQPADAAFSALEAAPVQLRLVSGARQIASAMIR
jgi:CHAD domain-containing protein